MTSLASWEMPAGGFRSLVGKPARYEYRKQAGTKALAMACIQYQGGACLPAQGREAGGSTKCAVVVSNRIIKLIGLQSQRAATAALPGQILATCVACSQGRV